MRAVYGGNAPDARRADAAAPKSRAEACLLAQLRSGHCLRLRAYANIINPAVTPACPNCTAGAAHTLEHWWSCPGLLAERITLFGTATPPPLSVLWTNPRCAALYAQQTLGHGGATH